MENTSFQDKKVLLSGLSLVGTVYNEAASIGEFLNSVYSMTHLPAEFVLVDGGSTDGTAEMILDFFQRNKHLISARLIVDSTCNARFTSGPIARGRNAAIAHASNGIIACVDAGCTVDKNWLAALSRPFSDLSVDAVAGWYVPDARSFFEACVAVVLVAPAQAVRSETVVPSSRSFAFRKSVWTKVGGYSERSFWGEDTMFVVSLRSAGLKMQFEPEAVVHWRMRSSLKEFASLVFGYGYGDGFHSIMRANIGKVLGKIGFAVLLLALGMILTRWFFLLLFLYWLLLPHNKRLSSAFKLASIPRLPIVAVLKVISDCSYAVGYFAGGRARRSSHSD